MERYRFGLADADGTDAFSANDDVVKPFSRVVDQRDPDLGSASIWNQQQRENEENEQLFHGD